MCPVDKTTAYQPIDCALHDELELLCLHRHTLSIYLHDGTPLTGIANTWTSDAHKAEYLIVRCTDGDKHIRLDRIRKIVVIGQHGDSRTINFQVAPKPA